MAFSASAAASEFVPVIAQPRGRLAKLDPAKPEDFAEILDRVSGELLQRPYQDGPLGEGKGAAEDPDPLYRLDAFDCTTFLETVMANAYCFAAKKPASCLEKKMRSIRYAGSRISFRERNHVPETDWLPHNEAKGYLEDLHGKLFASSEWREAKPGFDRELWLSSRVKGAPAAKGKKAAVPLHYLPISFFFAPAALDAKTKAELEEKLQAELAKVAAELQAPGLSDEQKKEIDKKRFRAELEYLRAVWAPVPERFREIPAGTVLNLVKAPPKDPAKAKLATLISHQGLLAQKPDGVYLRHAAVNVGHVSSQRLDDYLLRYLRNSHYLGISLYRILPAKKGRAE